MPGSLRRLLVNPAHRFLVGFALLLGVEAWLYPIATQRWFGAVDALTTATARIEYRVASWISADAAIEGKQVWLGGFSVRIIEECTGIFEALIFAAAVLAYPTSWARRAIGIGLGVPLLYLINLLRILALLAVGRARPDLFEFMHLYFWQATLILMITSVWLLWIFAVVRREPPGAARAA
jgi:exosortase H (IPTLxxWG-CTERM-specific)